MKKMLFVLNPNAGVKKANKHLAEILGIFNRAGYDVIVHVTASRGDALKIVKDRAAEVDIVVCCGGDGTYNEAMTGLLQSGADTPMGYIPAGSTNDFANSLKLPTDVVAAANSIAEGRVCRYDVGSFGGRFFAYVASFGAFTKVSYATDQNLKNTLGHLAYVLEGIQELSQIKRHHLHFETENGILEDDYIFGAICNSTSLGGVLKLDAKIVDMQDGKFELLLIRAPKDLAEIAACIQALQTKKYHNSNLITFCTTGKVKITAPENMPWTLDGEKEEGHAVVEVENLHRAVPLVHREGKPCD